VARLGTVVVRVDLGTVPALRLLGDGASASYLFGVLHNAMTEHEGCPADPMALGVLSGR
jgi:hypothetical protein